MRARVVGVPHSLHARFTRLAPVLSPHREETPPGALVIRATGVAIEPRFVLGRTRPAISSTSNTKIKEIL
jgi:hypothetical protein